MGTVTIPEIGKVYHIEDVRKGPMYVRLLGIQGDPLDPEPRSLDACWVTVELIGGKFRLIANPILFESPRPYEGDAVSLRWSLIKSWRLVADESEVQRGIDVRD
jgi:hypothetical protein